MTADDLVLDEARHLYSLDGIHVPSVTQILAPLSGMHLVNQSVLAAACDFGRAVHKACELDDLGQLDEADLDPLLAPYLAAWRAFSKDHSVRWSHIEARVYHAQMGYAGTVDRYGVVAGSDAVVDLKSGAALSATVGPQLAAYAKALPGTSACTHRIGVLLKKDGRYQAKAYVEPTDWPVFASLVTLRSFCARHEVIPHFKEHIND